MTNVNNTFKSTKVKYDQSTRTSFVPHTSKSKIDFNQYKTTFGNNVNLKFEITQIEQTSDSYWNDLNNIQGDLFGSNGVTFYNIVLKSLNYFFTNCIDSSTIKEEDWNLTFVKSLLDENNTTGYTSLLYVYPSKYVKVYEAEFYKECFAFIQLAYYLNEIDLTQNQFFIYVNHYLETNTKLPDNLYKLDLSYLHKKYNDFDKSKEKDFKTTSKTTIKSHFFGSLFIICNDLGLSIKNFKIDSKYGRDYSPMVKVPREFRKYFPFLLNQYDIKSAYPHFIDAIIDSNCAKGIYENLASSHNISRTEAKILFNKNLNSGKYYNREHFYKFFYPIYKDKTNDLIDLIKDTKKPIWKVLHFWEHNAIETFTESNRLKNVTRLHDAIFVIDDFYQKEIKTEFSYYSFGFERINEVQSILNFQVIKDKISRNYKSSLPLELRKFNLWFEADGKKGFKYKGTNFDVYNVPFEYIKASFNIAYKGKFVKDEFVFLSEKDFLKRCFNMVAVIRELNEDISFDVFKFLIGEIVEHIFSNSVYSFNKNTLIDLMVNEIENAELTPIVKIKDWFFKGNIKEADLTFYEFNSYLNEARKEAELYFQVSTILPIIKDSFFNRKKIFIRHSDVGITSKRGNEFLYELINDFNMCNGFGTDVRFAESLQGFLKVVHEVCHNKYSNTLIVTDIVYKASENALSKEFNIHRQTAKKIKNWFAFTQMRNRIENIYFTLQAIIKNTGVNYVIEKDKDRKLTIKQVIEEIQSEEAREVRVEPGEAFSYELDLKDSILNIEEEEALQKNETFYLSWFLFNYIGQYTSIEEEIMRDRSKDLFNGTYIPNFLRRMSA